MPAYSFARSAEPGESLHNKPTRFFLPSNTDLLTTMPLEALQYNDSAEKAVFKLLDQRELPLKTLYIDIAGPKAAFDAIKVTIYPLQLGFF